jgi:hypothetical protein
VEATPMSQRDKWAKCYLCIQQLSALKRKEILTHATAQMTLEDTTLSDINNNLKRQKKVKEHVLNDSTFMKYPEQSDFIETESRMVVARG